MTELINFSEDDIKKTRKKVLLFEYGLFPLGNTPLNYLREQREFFSKRSNEDIKKDFKKRPDFWKEFVDYFRILSE